MVFRRGDCLLQWEFVCLVLGGSRNGVWADHSDWWPAISGWLARPGHFKISLVRGKFENILDLDRTN